MSLTHASLASRKFAASIVLSPNERYTSWSGSRLA